MEALRQSIAAKRGGDEKPAAKSSAKSASAKSLHVEAGRQVGVEAGLEGVVGWRGQARRAQEDDQEGRLTASQPLCAARRRRSVTA